MFSVAYIFLTIAIAIISSLLTLKLANWYDICTNASGLKKNTETVTYSPELQLYRAI